ncbi:MAG: flagellar brake domain-containing protein [Muribaculaceae bacterium]|nr:flagellar brake domain-containing protein [Roseburia sp.]MCM1431056.1 flagellar brake domain-containing protein [Muribaculaceae bacterium]MCM1493316.1 flagellar brake domain-containing protein [Muribaculaceae bacterium]
MVLSDVIQLGNRIDVKLLRAKVAEDNGGEKAVVYQSSVSDMLSDMETEITMPMQGGRMVLFQVGAVCDLVFYTKRGMYHGIATVKGRYKKGNLYFLSIQVKELPQKFQRREYFRIDFLAEIQYYLITEKTARLETTNQLLAAIREPENMASMRMGTLQDISGGGAKFLSGEMYEKGSYLLLLVHLNSAWLDETFYLVCRVVESSRHPSLEDKFSNRVQFIYKDLRDREKIVRFVFEEERRMRKKEIG